MVEVAVPEVSARPEVREARAEYVNALKKRAAGRELVSIRFGVSPIAWINDDMPELGGDTPLEQVLGEARDIGFAGIELGGKFPRDAQA